MLRSLVVGGLLAVAWPEGAWAQRTPAGPKVNAQEYEGWKQYNTHCARCHGQDVLGNPVTADLLRSTAPGGPVADHDTFVEVVKTGRPSKGMPGFASILSDAQIEAIYVYVKGRAEGRIPPGRPQRPEG